jgi:hypothetical protein
MHKKLLVLLTITVALFGAVAGVATADPAQKKAGPKVIKVTVSPASGVRAGGTLVAKGTGALKKTEYFCVTSVVSRKGGKSLTASNLSNFKVVKSTKKGALTCALTYKPWSAADENGTIRHCPTTAADKRAGFRCAVAIADKATVGAKAAGVGYFTPGR